MNSTLDASHVVLPASLYHRMALCYYGSGPRASGSTPDEEAGGASTANGANEAAVAPDPQKGFNGDPPPPRKFTALVPQGRGRTSPPETDAPHTGGV